MGSRSLEKKQKPLKSEAFLCFGGLSQRLLEPNFLTPQIVDIIEVSPSRKYQDESFLTNLYLKKGLSLRQISKQLGCCKSTVRKKLNEAGVTDFEYVVKPNERVVEKIRRLQEQGDSYQKIADKFNFWRVETRSGEGKWYGKTVRDLLF